MNQSNKHIDFEGLTEDEKKQLLEWAERVQEIRIDKKLNLKGKLNALKALNNSSTFKNTSKFVIAKTKKHWKSANYTKRLALIAGVGTLSLVGFSGAGIAALGGAIGLPLFCLTAAGGAVIGSIIDGLKK
ncbi:hypothetical protein [Croceitalea sp. P059]|uniref:hypothetical protein n=1 Tax=Croceitalea sp. P059 TaxID=3075601 RepID=UPI002888EE02|nr:hypothetical protein [Croceitalea sp. P059]MDT0538866.1 hypothetical protein [Croceitalea sp. P059]